MITYDHPKTPKTSENHHKLQPTHPNQVTNKTSTVPSVLSGPNQTGPPRRSATPVEALGGGPAMALFEEPSTLRRGTERNRNAGFNACYERSDWTLRT